LTRIFRGEVYFADLEPTQGHEIKKTRPCVIVSNESININASVIIICPITDSYGKNSPIHIPISAGEGGLIKDSVVHCGQIRAIDKTRLGKKLGELGNVIMDKITTGLAYSIDVPQYPQININYK
jgi:mRNA interferase MazF